MLSAQDIMNARVACLSPDDTLKEAAALFAKKKISGAPVVGPGKRLLGVLSQSDLGRRADQRAARREPAFYYDGDRLQVADTTGGLAETPVRLVMTRVTLAVEPSEPIDRVARLMLEKKIHRVLVAQDGALRGLISSLDMIRGLLDALPQKRRARI